MAQRSKALHHSASCVTTDPGLIPGCVAAGRDHGVTHNCPASSRSGEGLAGRDVLVPSLSSDSCGGPGVYTVARCTVFPPTQWCGWLSVLGGVVFWRTRGSRPSPLLSLYGSCSDGPRLELPIGYGEKKRHVNI